MTTTSRRSRRRLFAVLGAVPMMIIACGGDDDADTGAGDGEQADTPALEGAQFTVGSKEFTEQQILGHIAKIALEDAGATVNDQIGLAGTAIVREALEAGEIDMYWEYTGTGWITHLGETEPILGDPQAQYEAVAERDLEENGVVWLEPGPFDNTYAVAAHESAIDELGISTLSDLQGLLEENPEAATFCVASEFLSRDDGLPGMEEHYDISFPEENLVILDEGAIYSAVADRSDCNLGEVFATDGRIGGLDLVVLEDDQEFFPIYNPALTIREEVFDEYPELADLFNPITAALDNETMVDLNTRVDFGGEFFEEVAEDFLQSNGFID